MISIPLSILSSISFFFLHLNILDFSVFFEINNNNRYSYFIGIDWNNL